MYLCCILYILRTLHVKLNYCWCFLPANEADPSVVRRGAPFGDDLVSHRAKIGGTSLLDAVILRGVDDLGCGGSRILLPTLLGTVLCQGHVTASCRHYCVGVVIANDNMHVTVVRPGEWIELAIWSLRGPHLEASGPVCFEQLSDRLEANTTVLHAFFDEFRDIGPESSCACDTTCFAGRIQFLHSPLGLGANAG